MKYFLALKNEIDAESPRGRALRFDHSIVREFLEERFVFRILVLRGIEIFGQLDDVIAGISILRKRKVRLAQLTPARVKRANQSVELVARVVDDPIGRDFIAEESQCIGECRPDCETAPLHDHERSRWIGAAELERKTRSGRRTATVVGASLEDFAYDLLPKCRLHPQIHEARDRLDF